MRDPNRIDLVLDAIREVWVKHPDMWLGQLIGNAVQPRRPNAETFATEDIQLVKKLGKLQQRFAGTASEAPEEWASIESLNEITGPDFRISSFNGWSLDVCASIRDYPGTWHSEITFNSVSFVDCPTGFSHAQFRPATSAERQLVALKAPIEHDDLVVAITAETMASIDSQTYFIACEAVSATRKAV